MLLNQLRVTPRMTSPGLPLQKALDRLLISPLSMRWVILLVHKGTYDTPYSGDVSGQCESRSTQRLSDWDAIVYGSVLRFQSGT